MRTLKKHLIKSFLPLVMLSSLLVWASLGHGLSRLPAPAMYSEVMSWGQEGSGPGQLRHPMGIAVDEQDFVYVADTENQRVVKFTSNGKFVATWGGPGKGQPRFGRPIGIAAGRGYVYVSDFLRDTIHKFKEDGTLLTQWGKSGSGEGQFDGQD